MRRSGAALALLALAAPLGAAEPRRPLTAEDVVGLPLVSDPRIAPAGDRVAFVVTRLSPPRERASEVWLVGTDGQGLVRVPLEQARAPRWSPDGKALAVVGGSPAAVHLFTPADGTVRAAAGTAGAREAAFSPDGTRLAFLRADAEPPRTDPVVVDEGPARHVRLWITDLSGAAPRTLLAEDLTVWRFGWSPDGRKLAVLASTSPLAEGLEYGSRLLLADLAGGAPRVLAEKTCPQSAPAFSPDGRWLAFLAPLGGFQERGVLHVVPTAGGGAPRPLAAAHPGTFWEAQWPAGAERVVAALGQGAEHALAAVALDGGVSRLVPLRHSIIPLWEPVWSADASGRRVAYLSETDGGREVWTATLDGAPPRRLTRFTAAVEEAGLGPVEAVRWTSARDGAAVEGILVSPAAASGRAPLLVWLHGGPAYHWGLGAQVQSWAQLFAARGYRVLLPNFRGSTGYGQAWLTANVGDWGDGPMADVMGGVDALVARGLADPERLYLGGGSYGGYLTYWMIGHTTRFRAAYLRAGISDPLSAYPLTDEPSFFSGYMGGTAYDAPDTYRRLAPLGAVNAVRTPLLIVHGEEDARVPPVQSHLFHAALRQRGVPTQLVLYPREGHSISEYAHQLDHLRRVFAWYERFQR
jgi:dipeptidyl aminopeptidase/acylaminoacyl peptidase